VPSAAPSRVCQGWRSQLATRSTTASRAPRLASGSRLRSLAVHLGPAWPSHELHQGRAVLVSGFAEPARVSPSTTTHMEV
jgi:hypothetical protein